ncbi:MAG: YfbK domain-containing protein, partial [Candidatus Zixiibacteriota bacterium]
ITLSTIGVGMGNYNDVLLEKLGDKGNGFYAYVDNIEEARSVFQKNLSNALQVIARDVKVQVEFDPEYVSRNRLLGYENRKVDDHQFRNDCTDGGEIGPGHSVTALYEINIKSPYERPWLNDSPDNQDLMNIGHIFIRYKNPANGCVEEVNGAIPYATFKHRFVKGSPDFKLATAAAEFGEIMRDSYWAKNSSLNDVLQLASEVYRQTGKEDVREFVELITKARDLRALESDYFSKE